MRGAVSTILDAIGQTPLVELQQIGAGVEAKIFVKCEFLNPSGSAKDRMAARLVARAEASGALEPGGTIIEATSGNTGAALAMVAAVKGYRSIFVVPDKTSPEKIAALRAYGAKVVVCPAALEPDDARRHHAVAARLAEETPKSFFANQMQSADNPDAYGESLGAELWEQTGGEIDVLVAGLGTGGTLIGAGRHLSARREEIKLVGVDPVGSLYADFAATGRVNKPFAYEVEGIGGDFFPSVLDLDVLHEVVRVDDRESFSTCRDLVRLEGLFAGGSSGAAVAGAIAYARRTGEAGNIVVILTDGAAGYLSKAFNDDWMREHGLLDEDEGLGAVRELLADKGGAEVITAHITDRVRDVIGRMKAHGISQLPITDGDGLVGAVAEVDLLRYLVSGEHSLDGPVEPLIESEFATVSPSTPVAQLSGLLNRVRMAIVIDGSAIAGVVTKIDLIDYLARRKA